MSEKKYYFILIYSLFSFLISISIATPFAMISTGSDSYYFFKISSFLKAISPILIAISLIVLGISFFLKKIINKRIVLLLIIWPLFFLIFSCLLFPLTESSGMINAEEIKTSKINLFYSSLSATLISFFFLTKKELIGYIFLTVLVVSSILSNIPNFKDENLKDKITSLSKTKNILVVSFDGLPSNIVNEIFKSDEILLKKFSDFTFYTNATSNAPATAASIRHELFGNHDYHSTGIKTEIELSKELNKEKANNLPINLIDDGYAYSIYGSYARKKVNMGQLDPYAKKILELDQHRQLAELITARSISPFIFKKLKIKNIFEYSKEKIYKTNQKEGRFSHLLHNYKNTSWKSAHIISNDDYLQFIEDLKLSDSNFSIRQMHFTHTHFPVDFDENCIMRSTDEYWVNSSQNSDGLKNQTKCAIKQFSMLIDKLKNLGIYDNSLIIFKSDHGEPVSYFNTPPNNLKINDHDLWGYNRYRPTLIIKKISETKDLMGENDDFVFLSDLSKTICKAADLNHSDCSEFNGIDLLGEFSSSLQPDVSIEVVKTSNSDFRFDSHKTIQINRNKSKDLYESLKANKEITIGE